MNVATGTSGARFDPRRPNRKVVLAYSSQKSGHHHLIIDKSIQEEDEKDELAHLMRPNKKFPQPSLPQNQMTQLEKITVSIEWKLEEILQDESCLVV